MSGDSPDVTALYKNKRKLKLEISFGFEHLNLFFYESYGSSLLQACEGITKNTCFYSLP